MTREKYLSELKSELRSLPEAEQVEALEYFKGYFEDADNDDEVMASLGTPQELAKTILERFVSVPEIYRPRENQDGHGSYGSFKDSEVRSLDISIGAAEAVITTGDSYSVEYKNMEAGDITVGLSGLGTLSIRNNATYRNFTFWMRKNNSEKVPPRILIKVPEDAKLDLFKVNLGAGTLTSSRLRLRAEKINLNVGAGNLVLDTVFGGSGKVACGMGNLEYTGTISGRVAADCGMGKLQMNLTGKESDYSFAASVGLGSVQFNKIQKNGIGKLSCSEKKPNHIEASCGMGLVKIDMRETV